MFGNLLMIFWLATVCSAIQLANAEFKAEAASGWLPWNVNVFWPGIAIPAAKINEKLILREFENCVGADTYKFFRKHDLLYNEQLKEWQLWPIQDPIAKIHLNI